MCYRPLFLKNPSSYFDVSRPFQYKFSVPCGNCDECNKKHEHDYAVRSYAQWQECKDNGGYAYFETLTLSPENVPHIGDLLVFNRDHFKNFMKRLRINLSRAGFDVKNKLKYFFTSEYGTLKKRPHYHVIFYVLDSSLSVTTLRYYVNKSWNLGFIDHLCTLKSRVVNGVGAIYYIAKYVRKDNSFSLYYNEVKNKYTTLAYTSTDSKVRENAKRVLSVLDGDKKTKNTFFPFHRQSIGFGSYLLKMKNLHNIDNIHEIFEHGTVSVPDKLYMKKSYGVPTYIKRKLFYYTVKQKDVITGEYRVRWVINDLGIKYKMYRLNETIKLLSEQYQNIYTNIQNYIHDYESAKVYQSFIDKLLQGRTYVSFVIYLLLYRGRNMVSHCFTDDYMKLYEDSLQPYEITDSDTFTCYDVERMIINNDLYIIDDTSLPQFKYFDTLYNLFNFLKKQHGSNKTEPFNNYINKIKSILKQ